MKVSYSILQIVKQTNGQVSNFQSSRTSLTYTCAQLQKSQCKDYLTS